MMNVVRRNNNKKTLIDWQKTSEAILSAVYSWVIVKIAELMKKSSQSQHLVYDLFEFEISLRHHVYDDRPFDCVVTVYFFYIWIEWNNQITK